ITTTEHNILMKNYTEYWYEKFFNVHHIAYIKETTLQNPIRMTELEKIYGKEWLSIHFIDYKKRLRGIEYSYSSKIRDIRERRMIKKLTQMTPMPEELID